MQHQPVKSSNIQSVAYDENTQALHVKFKSGAEYKYSAVPPDEYEALLSAPSVGSYLNDNIKSTYNFQRV